ncbi:hypothetical protein NDU88_003151 [Pleurodeles waltl]|uniref:Uncharacterized protein n=1 Tax=Pleurodeles waltl TaxID=8319 RepID=A0AAV7NFS7_PLEWA|nr:hypothetical protein NDU88_003151 [Pleurodeles waltl]
MQVPQQGYHYTPGKCRQRLEVRCLACTRARRCSCRDNGEVGAETATGGVVPNLCDGRGGRVIEIAAKGYRRARRGSGWKGLQTTAAPHTEGRVIRRRMFPHGASFPFTVSHTDERRAGLSGKLQPSWSDKMLL